MNELFEELIKFFSYAPADEKAIEEIAKGIVAKHDLQHFFICKQDSNTFILRWIDNFGYFDTIFTAEEIKYLLFKEDMEEIKPYIWYNLHNDLSILSNDYMVFDEKFRNGKARFLVNLLIEKYKNKYPYISNQNCNNIVEIENIPYEEVNPN